VPAGRRPTEPHDQQGSAGSPRQATSQLVQTRPTQWEGSTLAIREGLGVGRSRSGWSRDIPPGGRSGFLDVDQGAMRGTVAKARAWLGDPGPRPVACVRRPTRA